MAALRKANNPAAKKSAFLKAVNHLSANVLQRVNYILVLKKNRAEQTKFKPNNKDDFVD